jgi:hypothetical protein
VINWLCSRPRMTKARPRTATPDCSGRQNRPKVPLDHVSATVGVCAILKEFDHGPHGEAAMSVVLNDLLLFSCLAALVTGIVIAAATLII